MNERLFAKLLDSVRKGASILQGKHAGISPEMAIRLSKPSPPILPFLPNNGTIKTVVYLMSK